MINTLIWLAAKAFIPDERGELTAVDSSDPAPPMDSLTELPPGDYGAVFVKMILTMVVIIALLFITVWFIRRLIQQRLQKGVGDASIQILEKRMISPKTMLYLIEVEEKKVLIAESHLEVKRLESFPLETDQRE